MHVKNIEITNFRNYKKEYIDFNKNINILVGENGQGKTNLVESLYICSLGKSFRTSKFSDMIKFDEEFFKVKLISEKYDNNEYKIEFLVDKNKREVKINNNKISKYSELLNGIHIVVFSPEDLKMVKGSPEERRKFLDKQISQLKPFYLECIVKYKKIINQRNFLLKKGNITREKIEIWDEQLSYYGAKIIEYRKNFIKKIDKISCDIHKNITGGKELLKIEYDSNIKIKENLKDQKEEIRRKLDENLKYDILRKSTSVGIQRDDIKIYSNDIDMRYYGSQGQQRSSVLSMKLAEVDLVKEEKGDNCILILDDVLSELDEKRQNFLIQYLKDNQVFITSAYLPIEIINNIGEKKVFTVKDGEIIRVNA